VRKGRRLHKRTLGVLIGKRKKSNLQVGLKKGLLLESPTPQEKGKKRGNVPREREPPAVVKEDGGTALGDPEGHSV